MSQCVGDAAYRSKVALALLRLLRQPATSSTAALRCCIEDSVIRWWVPTLSCASCSVIYPTLPRRAQATCSNWLALTDTWHPTL